MGDACCGHDTAHDPNVHRDDAPGGAGRDDGEAQQLWEIREVRLAAISGVLLAMALGAGAAGVGGASEWFFAAALVVGGATFVPDTLRALARGRLGVGTLMTVAAVGAVALGELGEAASLAFLFSISEALEGYALARTRRGLRALLALVPPRVTVRRGDGTAQVHPDDLVIGDVMVIAPGERVATDGTVVGGRSSLDLSAITGESVPVEVTAGSAALAASINQGGVLDLRVDARTADSSLARIVHIVEEAQGRKGASQRLAERVARPLVPGVMVVAAATAALGALFGDPKLWFARSLVVLVAAAPCAFAIGVPVTVVAAIGRAARMGVLIKGGAALEALSGVQVVALDKTGTVTANQPSVTDVIAADGAQPGRVLAVAAALEVRSEHPLAAAITDACPQVREAIDVQAITGHGLTGTVDGRRARLGKPGFIDPAALAPSVERLQADGCTVVLVEHDQQLLGAIAVRDELRPEAPAVVAELRRLGITKVAMLTGDNARTADALGCHANVDEIHAELLPTDKVTVIRSLSAGGAVAMVGDGVNDAPALATADVGIAMGAAGSDVAIEAADVALMGEDLTHLPDAVAHARRAGRIMRQNLAISALILAALVPLAATGMLGLAAVVAIHELAEVLVIVNGVRAGRHRQGRAEPPTAPEVQPVARLAVSAAP